jgi:hypothetical protein
MRSLLPSAPDWEAIIDRGTSQSEISGDALGCAQKSLNMRSCRVASAGRLAMNKSSAHRERVANRLPIVHDLNKPLWMDIRDDLRIPELLVHIETMATNKLLPKRRIRSLPKSYDRARHTPFEANGRQQDRDSRLAAQETPDTSFAILQSVASKEHIRAA